MDIYHSQLNPIFQNNGNINVKMRAILVDWLLEVSKLFKCRNKTFHLGIMLLDRYLQLKVVDKDKLQCVGSACLYIASVSEEIYHADIDDWIHIMADTYERSEFIYVVTNTLNTLEYKLYYDTYYDVLYKKFSDNKLEQFHLEFSNYLLTSLLISRRYLFFDKYQLADLLLSFSISFKESSMQFESLIKNDYKYAYIFDQWKRIKDSVLGCIGIYKDIIIPNILYKLDENIEDILIKQIIPTQQLHNNNNLDLSGMVKIRKLGQGTYGKVNKCRLKNGIDVAIKYFKSNCDELSSSFLREVNILIVLDHKNIVKMLHVSNLCIVLEIMDMNLDTFIKNNTINNKRNYIKQILDAVNYLHSMNIMHRDITSKNFLISGTTIKLCDFGMARKIGHFNNLAFTGLTCSFQFRPIEFIFWEHDRNYGYELDIWSTGCVIGHILKGDYLFMGSTKSDIILDIVKTLGPPSDRELYYMIDNYYHMYNHEGCPDLEKKYPVEMQLIYKMLNYDKTKRITLPQALQFWEQNIS